MYNEPTLLDTFRRWAADAPHRPALAHFDTVLTYGEVDSASDGLAVALAAGGFGSGDRAALYLQNVPQYVIALLAIWKLGGSAVPINPMLTPGEVVKLADDATPRVLIALDELYTRELADALGGGPVERVITTNALDWQNPSDGLHALIAEHWGRRPDKRAPVSGDVAVITYTSGTTGKPKGATNTHGNIVTGGRSYREWFALADGDTVLGIAPLFHVTGLTGHIATAIAAGGVLVLCNRFRPDVVLDAVRRHRPTFTVGALTAFIALAESDATRPDLASLTTIASGGAPVAVGVLERFQDRFGTYIHNVYGMTETTCPVLAVPMGDDAPVDPQTGALSVGKPLPGVDVAVLDDEGQQLPPGQIGELAVSGPQVVPGYWNQPDQTAAAFHNGRLLTGDVGYVDDAGWFYLVDRKKDMIVASGYKVWPREVEDVLYTHEAVREAAVVGHPDPYRGETVKAFVSLREGHIVDADALIEFCRQRMAAYKYPRSVAILDEIPKTATGKIMRRVLRSERA
ncbi:acyl-CoA synthetase [Mycobacterium sp. E342]|uniref:class I adenylate-forming enzyme family protein n=1 Tax=unclassified Mycobacterium TaxID=2642494 RepID=UPI00080171E1|nr:MULTISPECIES: AMP-binding protein [unclassified Mycobacterium]OBH01632.1 acyl-CoA synthetase [Mycobacterium sp. E3247]OBH31523.1 acyl-CoA synthetase [Mycobacterium sp. E342]